MTARACTVAGVADGVGQARDWVVEALHTAGCAGWLVDTAGLVVSELVMNAVVHTASGQPEGTVRIELLVGVGRARVSVMDAGTEASEPRVPRSCPDPDTAQASRGLYLVDQWAERIGVHGDGRRGRIVFADIAEPSTSPSQDTARSGALPKRRLGTRPGGRIPQESR